MYSYDDCIRAVKLYLKFGKRASATVQRLGYATVKALKAYIENADKGAI